MDCRLWVGFFSGAAFLAGVAFAAKLVRGERRKWAHLYGWVYSRVGSAEPATHAREVLDKMDETTREAE